jgi:hypothetical protein
MAKKTETTSKPEFAIVANDPADVVAALHVRDLVAEYAAGSSTRSKLTDEDLEALEAILQAANADASELRRVTFSRSTKLGEEAGGIINRVLEFRELNVENQKIPVGSKVFSVPAIESEHLRQEIVKLGAALLAAIDVYVQNRRAEIERERQKLIAEDAQLQAAKKVPILQTVLQLLEEAAEISYREPSWGIAHSLVESAVDGIRRAISINEALGRLERDKFNSYTLKETVIRQVRAKLGSEKQAAA